MELITTNKDTITSLELLKQINIFRKEEGNRAKLQHSDLLKVIRDEFSEEIGLGKISESSYLNSQNKKQPMFELTTAQAKQVLVRESKFVRKRVIHYIEELENKLKLSVTKKDELLFNIIKAHDDMSKAVAINKYELEYVKPLEKKADYHDTVLKSDKLITSTNIAKDLGMSAVKLNNILHELKVIYKRSNTWVLYEKYQNRVPEYCDYIINEYGQQLKWTEKGRKFIIELFRKNNIIK